MKRMHWTIVGAAAAMLAFSTVGVRAQDTGTTSTDTTTSTTTTDTTTGTTSGTMSTTTTTGAMSGSMSGTMTGGTGLDYSVLSNQNYDYTELTQARAKGLSEDQVATCAKIAEKTGQSFRSVVDLVLAGQTFAALADKYNLRLTDVLDVNDEKAKIAAYQAAYRNTGKMALQNMGGGMSGSMSGTMGTTGSMGTSGTGTGTPGTADTTTGTMGTTDTTTTTPAPDTTTPAPDAGTTPAPDAGTTPAPGAGTDTTGAGTTTP